MISTIKNDAKSFVENLKKLYSDQLDVLNSSKLDTGSADTDSAVKKVEDVHGDVSSLVDEVKEFSSAIPEKINIPEIPHKEFDDSDVKVEKPSFDTPVPDEKEEPEAEQDEPETENNIDEVVNSIIHNETSEPPVITTDDDDEFEENEDEQLDPMEAVEAFSQNEITPIDKSAVPEISEDADMENDDSLFDEGDQLPFENYFNVNREDVHNDKSQTISLIPPEDDEDEDDEPKFKGFFKKKK